MELREYQKRAITESGAAIESGLRSFIVCLPTGAGKTVIFSQMARQAHSNGFTVLIITDSKKLFTQTERHFENPQVINAGTKFTGIKSGIIVSMAQTLVRRPQALQALNSVDNLIVIVDEAHIQTSCSPLYKLDNAIKIGFTATPEGKHLKGLFESIIDVISVGELVLDNYLCRCESWSRRVVDITGIGTRNGDYDEEGQTEAFKGGFSGLLEDLKGGGYKKAIVFTSCIRQCDITAAYLRDNGIKCAVVHSKCDEIEDFYSGVDVCISVGMLTKGFDFPAIDLVILFRATKSLPLYLQMVGRGSRLNEGKNKFRFIDYGSNIKRHGLWSSDRDWSLDYKEPKKRDEESISGLKICECEGCGFVGLEPFDYCPECGLENVTEVEVEATETELIKWEDLDMMTASAEDLYRHAVKCKKRRAAMFAAVRRGKDFVEQYAVIAGYKKGFSHKIFDVLNKRRW